MRLENALGLRFGGKDALEARLGGQVVWSGDVPWTPTQLFTAGQQGVWYEPRPEYLFQDAAGTVPVTADGDPVGYMQDLSGNGHHATQSTSAARPIYKTDGVLHWLQFDGVDDGLRTANGVLNTPVVTLAIAGSAVEGDSVVIGIPAAPTTHVSPWFRVLLFKNSSDEVRVRSNAIQTDHGDFPDATSVFYLSTSEDFLRVDGVNRPGAINSETVTYPNTVPLLIGQNAAGGENIAGNVYAVIGRGLSSTEVERQEMELYLANLAGVTL